MMSMTEALLFLAAEIAADLVDCPLKVEVSIPESFKIHFVHLDKAEDVTGLCGVSIYRNNGFCSLSEIPGQNSLVKPSYCFR